MSFEEKLKLCRKHHIPYAITTFGRFVVLEWPEGVPDDVKNLLQPATCGEETAAALEETLKRMPVTHSPTVERK